MADLTVAHHPVGHADVQAARLDQGHGIFRVEPVVAGFAGQMHGVELVVRGIRVVAPAVADDEEHGAAV